MSIILKKREDIINNSNNAQEIFLGILGKLNKRSPKIEINEPLSGNLDFSVLKSEGFSNVKKIKILKKGSVTSVTGLPDNLEEFYAPFQLLIDFPDIPKSLVELNLEKNFIESIDVSKLSKLKVLKLSDNNISTLDNLPISLEEIYVNSNNIRKLDLKELFQLRILHVSNNKSIILRNFPPSVVDFKSKNTPFIDIKHAIMYDEEAKHKADEEDGGEDEEKLNYIEALNDYFKLKSMYEQKSHKSKKKIFEKEGLSKKEKKRLLASHQDVCIKCKKPGGTIFEKRDNTYYAHCGNKSSPCNLQIEIYAGKYCSNHFAIATEHERINAITSKIIQEKLNTIFGYETDKDAVAKFKKQIEEFTFYNNDYKDCIERNNNLYKDEIKEELIKRKQIRIYEIVGAIKDLVEQFEKTDNRDLLRMAVELQVKELIPETENLRMLKHEIMEMITEDKKVDGEEDEKTEKKAKDEVGEDGKIGGKKMFLYTLYQRYASLYKNEYNVGKPPKVIHFTAIV